MIQLEEINNPAKAHTSSGFSLLSRQLVVFFAAVVSLALPAIALAQQSAKTGQQIQDAIKTRVAKINNKKKDNTITQPGTATQLESLPSTAADAIRPFPKINVSQEAIDKLGGGSPIRNGRKRRPSQILRKACRLRPCRNSRAIGPLITIGERRKRS